MKNKPVPKSVIITGLISGSVGSLLFATLFIRNLHNEKTLLVTALFLFMLLHVFFTGQSIFRLIKYNARRRIKS